MISADYSGLVAVVETARTAHCYEANRPHFLEAAVRFLEQTRQQIQDHHRHGASGTETVKRITLMTDQLVSALFEFVVVDVDTIEPCALIALGGYGRSEMNPRSDVDLMFYAHNSTGAFIHQLSERMLYLLWDLGLDVGHSVRNESECIDIAEKDLTACTALLDSRFVCGDRAVYDHYAQRVLADVVKNNSRKFIREKLVEHSQRLKKYGSSVYLLEPNIKEGEGGLRDLHTTLWISKVKYKVDSLRGLVIKGVMSEADEQNFLQSLDYLLRIRTELHYLSTRKNEQLHFDQQEKIAQFLGYKNNKKALAVEQFMRDYYEAATRVEHLTSTLIARATDRDKEERGFVGYLRRRNIEDGFYALRGELHLSHPQLFADKPEFMMKAFWLAQRHQLELSLQIKTLIREHLPLINDRFRRSRPINEIFLDILRHKSGVYKTLSQMHHLLFLNQYLPEFKRIYCQVQHDAYHIYTVDTHTLFAVKEVVNLWQQLYAEKKPLLTRIADEIEKPELMILAVLMHDVGKGEGHKHCEKGALMMPTIARRLGLGKEDSLRLEFLVRHHLQMAHTSQRRDLHDPFLISQFAQMMGSSENLKMLYLLTFADIKAVGPDVWSEWKGFLLQELYEKTYAVLEKGNFYNEQSSEKIRNRKRKVIEKLCEDFDEKTVKECLRNFSTRYLMSNRSEQIIKHLRVFLSRGNATLAMQVNPNKEQSFTEVIIVTLDIPGLFSTITGVMAANGVNILGAQIYTQKTGVAVDVLQVGRDGLIYDDEQKWNSIRQDLIWYLEGRGQVEDLVQKRKKSVLNLSRPVPSVVPRVEIDNEVSNEYTVIDIAMKDKVGLLYQMTATLKKLGLYIGVAKITTKGDRAGDTFYVQDIFGHKILQPEKLDELQKSLLENLSE